VRRRRTAGAELGMVLIMIAAMVSMMGAAEISVILVLLMINVVVIQVLPLETYVIRKWAIHVNQQHHVPILVGINIVLVADLHVAIPFAGPLLRFHAPRIPSLSVLFRILYPYR
jgi:hypothetical protein